MKKRTIFLSSLLALSIVSPAMAHPGRTDGGGGHYCRTNCADWGFTTGEYHYHNSGGSSSGSSGGSSSSSSGSPSSPAPSNEPSAEEIAAQQAAADKSNGEDEGYASGVDDGYAAASKSAQGSGSAAYNEGYSAGYEKGYAEGLKKLESERVTAQSDGTTLGQKSDKLVVPEKYSANAVLKDSFTSAFNSAVKKRDEAAIAKYSDMGYQDGLKDMQQTLDNMKESYHQAYEDGFAKGLAELKAQYVDKGYQAAFTTLTYQAPQIDNTQFAEWYKEGFESNQDVKEIQTAAFEQGDAGDEYSLPAEYEHAEVIYEYYYNEGLEEHNKDNAQAAGGVGIAGLAWLARRFYVAKKSIS